MEHKSIIQPGQQIALTVLGYENLSGAGRIVDIDRKRTRISYGQPLPFGAALRLDANDAMLLGEVMGSVPLANDTLIEVKINQVVPSMSNLAKLVNAVIGATPRDRSTAPDAAQPEVGAESVKVERAFRRGA